ncbi:hypothetical protein IFM89_015074 [Coptis chinensis]|uniref:Uncharacterized protein n=1 Tax=Coptis chinensis TaxID=261450 RepID=A0A835H6I8_9MAGN|nr:hypothetical protein IFM89_015074 [Coptis chinensis]
MKKALFILVLCLLVEEIVTEPRAQVVEFKCGTVLENNVTAFVPNFIGTTEKISDLMRTAGFRITQMGTGPDANYGLAQCYGDLNLLDCVLCYAEARGRLPGCFPYNLDVSTLMVALCVSRTIPSMMKSQVQKTRPYVLANCWKTLNASSCRACLDNASASVMTFSKGVIIAIVVSSVALAVIGAIIGLTIRKNRILQRKRRGSSDIVKMSRTLNDSSLNFKFSTLQKATGNFDDANKLGQGGFGIVYKGVLADGREIAVKRLFVNNRHRASDFYNEVNSISTVEYKNLVRGYMAPEYLTHGQLTEKADVYSTRNYYWKAE